MRMSLWLFLISIYTWSLVSCSNEILSSSPQAEQKYNFDQKLLGAHRGMSGYPENTTLSVQKAAEFGYKIVEFDVCITKDSFVVVHHDATIDRTSNGRGDVRDYTLEELRKFDFGGGGISISTLNEMLFLCKQLNLAVELDLSNNSVISNDDVELIYKAVVNSNALSFVLFCSTLDRINRLKELDNDLNVSCVSWHLGKSEKEVIPEIVELKHYVNEIYVDINYLNLSRELVDAYHKEGLKVNCYTVNGEKNVREMFDMGCDYVLTEDVLPQMISDILH